MTKATHKHRQTRGIFEILPDQGGTLEAHSAVVAAAAAAVEAAAFAAAEMAAMAE